MKSYIPYSLLAAAAACGMAFGAETAYTTPVGYSTTTIKQGFNLTALTLQTPVVVAGSFTAVSGSDLTDTKVADFAAVLTSGRTFILEITSGTGIGVTQPFVTRLGSTITTPAPVGAAVGDNYKIRIAPTLEEVFGTTTSILAKNNNGSLADNVYVPNGTGGFNRYFLNNSNVWRLVTPAGAAPNVPLIYLDGIFIERKATGTVDFVNSGEVKKGITKSIVRQGFNQLGANYPAGTTLQNFGFETSVLKSNNGSLADNIYIPDGLGGYIRYFLNASNVWRIVTPAGAAPADVPLTSGFLYERKTAGTISVVFTPPASYSSL
jgi:hypothetical protein